MSKLKHLLTLLAVCLALTGYSQTTNTTTTGNVLNDIWNFTVAQGFTNLAVRTIGTYTPAQNKWGGGLIISRGAPIGQAMTIAPGIGVDWYNNHFYAFNGNVSLSADIMPFSSFTASATNGFAGWLGKVKARPIGILGIGTPISNSPNNTHDPETYEAAGMEFDVLHTGHLYVSILGLYGSRQGLGTYSGPFYGGGPSLHWSF